MDRVLCGIKARSSPVMPPGVAHPRPYDRDLADRILARIAEGESLAAICRADHMPSAALVHRWVADDTDGLRERYARAREVQAHTIADLALADALTATDAQLGRLALDARKWFAAKVAPTTYGDTLKLAGHDGGALTVAVRRFSDPPA